MPEENKDSSLDILGIKPIGDAANIAVTKSFEGIEGFLKVVCVPALEELGLLIRDKIRSWRLNNIRNILEKAQGKVNFENGNLELQAHPRVALSIMENGSLNDNDEIQEMWAGLFASSCNKDGQDDENLIFVDLLKQITVCEARILKFACEVARKIIHESELIVGDKLEIDCETLIKISGVNEIHRLDRELDHLRSLDLIGGNNIFEFGGFRPNVLPLTANITPTALALNLYIKTQGHNIDPKFYWTDNIVTYKEIKNEGELKLEKERRKFDSTNN